MAINFDGIIVERIFDAIAEMPGKDKNSGELLYRLTQLSEASIDTTTENKEAKDAQGILIKRTYNSKSVEFKATNAFLDLNVLGQTTGSGKKKAGKKASNAAIRMPREIIVSSTEKEVTLPTGAAPIDGTVRVNALTNTGALGVAYSQSSTSAATGDTFAVDADGTKIALPTTPSDDVAQFLIKYEYDSETGIMVDQRADQFPQTVKLTLNVLVYDPCSTGVLRHAYLVFPSFQVSPDTSFTLTTESTMDFSGVAQVDYCSPDKQLYYWVMAEDDTEAN